MRIKPWVKMPSHWILNGSMATDFNWAASGRASRSAAIAALQIFVGLVTQSEESEEDGSIVLVAEGTYTSLIERTGLSRALVASGLSALEDLQLIKIDRAARSNHYQFLGYDPSQRWCKLPTRALYGDSLGGKKIIPFGVFQKRSIYELDAMKMYLYFAAIRSNQNEYSQATFETIFKHTGVAEKRIPRANSLLITSKLLAKISQGEVKDKKKPPNSYFLLGYRDLFVGKPPAAS